MQVLELKQPESRPPATERKMLLEALRTGVSGACTDCGLCLNQCEFLKRFGSPKRIADGLDPEDPKTGIVSFSCSLCGLCTAICPKKVDPVPLFREMRCAAFESGDSNFPEHRGLLRYEARGYSSRYSWYGFPEGCDTIFFPGCHLPGTRPGQTLSVFRSLETRYPGLGIALDCCTKPSHDLGRTAAFRAAFGALKTHFLSNGIRTVIVACPNCYRVFADYGAPLRVMSVYEVLPDMNDPNSPPCDREVSVHDSCAVRFDATVQASVRRFLQNKGMTLVEMPNSGALTLCCGEGAGVSRLNPGLAEQWAKMRGAQAGGRPIITYCAGCAGILSKVTDASHILDRICTPDSVHPFKPKVYRPPMTYINRLRLKLYFKRKLRVKSSGERPFKKKK